PDFSYKKICFLGANFDFYSEKLGRRRRRRDPESPRGMPPVGVGEVAARGGGGGGMVLGGGAAAAAGGG
uniref:Uncharacterized protein n=1 Tax=Oryza brachyantha TaxID=4533 RepID=J3M3C0_ORYBR